ncbi:MAG: nucleoside phosphorylase [Anaerovoracaceae bacterium]
MFYKDFDTDKSAIIEPHRIIKKIDNFPEIGLACFSKKLLDKLVELWDGTEIAAFKTEEGPLPIYKINYNNKPIALMLFRVGAPCASMQLEEAIAFGVKKLIAMGSCGVLDKSIPLGKIVIPTSGIRDEGTSYHYLPPSDEIYGNTLAIDSIKSTLDSLNYPYTLGKAWTTDALYRETKSKLISRKKLGCTVVDMEFTALQAVAQFRNIVFGQIFYSQDNLDDIVWDNRGSAFKANATNNGFLSIGVECASRL